MSRTFRNRGNKNPLIIHPNRLNMLSHIQILDIVVGHYTDNNRTWKEMDDSKIFHKLVNKRFRKQNKNYTKDVGIIDDIPTPTNKRNLAWLVY